QGKRRSFARYYQGRVSCDHRVPRALLAGQSVEVLLIACELRWHHSNKGHVRETPPSPRAPRRSYGRNAKEASAQSLKSRRNRAVWWSPRAKKGNCIKRKQQIRVPRMRIGRGRPRTETRPNVAPVALDDSLS